MIYPGVFEGRVMAFFTDREVGLDVSGITGRSVYMPVQEHTGSIIELGASLAPRVGDAVFTIRRDVLIGVKTADCVPVLLHDPVNMVMGAVHAGWRGTAQGILRLTIQAMSERYSTRPSDILLAIGPAIRWCCYEVGRDVLDAVVAATGEGDYHKVRDGKLCLDLPEANLRQAISVGVMNHHVWISDECTWCHPEKYYSYRYDQATGRQGGFIGMP